MKIFKNIILSIILLPVFGCNNDDDVNTLEGNIVGFVNLIDENGNWLDDNSGVNVSVEGTEHSTLTNENGRFELTNLQAGTYNIVYSKDDSYGPVKRYSYQFVGGEIPAWLNEIRLFEKPSLDIQNLDISFENNRINISGKLSEETDRYSFQTFINDSSNVSKFHHDFSTHKNDHYCCPTNEFSQRIYLENTPYSIGDRVFLAIYFINYYDDTAHQNPKYNKSVYWSSIKVSEVIPINLESQNK